MSSHPRKEKEESGERRMRLTRQEESKDNLFALGARDAKELSDAQVRIQPR
jgi:hypothetical protein